MTEVVKPMKFDAANRWLAGRVNVPTIMSSGEIALSRNFPPKVRAHAFFSAKVAEARVVEKLRKISDDYSRGAINLAEARGELKSWLAGKGYQPDDVVSGAGNSMSNLASTARLNLVLRQNASMANAVGKHEISMDPDVMTRFPYLRYISALKETSRETHVQLHDTVLPKNDPIWNVILPPSAFGCLCDVEDVDKEEAKIYGGVNQAVVKELPDGTKTAVVSTNRGVLNISTPASGYVFDVREAFSVQDMSRIANVAIRRAVLSSLAKFARENDSVRFNCIPGRAASSTAPVSGSGKIASYIDKQAAAFAESGAFIAGEIEVGSLTPEVLDGLGMSSGKVYLGKGTTAFGLTHMTSGHLAEITDGRFAKAIKETLFSKGVRTSLHMTGKKTFIVVYSRKTGALSAIRKFGEKSDWQIVSAHYPGKEYAANLGGLSR